MNQNPTTRQWDSHIEPPKWPYRIEESFSSKPIYFENEVDSDSNESRSANRIGAEKQTLNWVMYCNIPDIPKKYVSSDSHDVEDNKEEQI